jgi:hypothetical protein
VDHALALHALPYPGLDQQVDRPVLEHAGADALLDVLPASILEHNGLDPLQVQEVA